jgi:hypothetical protein
MGSISAQPANQNPLQSSKFQLTFDRLPYTTFFCKSLNVPGLSLEAYLQPTALVNLYSPGNKLTYEDFAVTFIIDEDLRSWQSIHDWIRGVTFPTTFDEYVNLPLQQVNPLSLTAKSIKPQYSDASFTIYTNKNNPHINIKFTDCFPISLTSIDFSVDNDADIILFGTATFKFSYYNITRL